MMIAEMIESIEPPEARRDRLKGNLEIGQQSCLPQRSPDHQVLRRFGLEGGRRRSSA